MRSPSGTRYVASAISRRKHDEALRELLLQLAIADLAALVAASFVGYRTARAALDPVERYRRTVERLERGSDVPHERLPVDTDRDDELTRLGHTFNDLLDRLEDAARRERQFLADTSHELRSPLSLMRDRAGDAATSTADTRGDPCRARVAPGPGREAHRDVQRLAGSRGGPSW